MAKGNNLHISIISIIPVFSRRKMVSLVIPVLSIHFKATVTVIYFTDEG